MIQEFDLLTTFLPDIFFSPGSFQETPMAETLITPEDMIYIAERIQEGECVLFLGAGVNVNGGTYSKGLPLGGEVALRLLGKWMDLHGEELKKATCSLTDRVNTSEKIQRLKGYEDLTRVALQNLSRVALHVEFRYGFKRLLRYLKEILPEDECEPSPLLRTLARLPAPQERTDPPFQLIVTTNYDRWVG